jgi:phosphate transport system substrate-binding protein
MKKIVTVLLALASFAVSAQQITGAGATFPFPIYSKWASEYNKATGIRLNYQSIGSGGGVQQIKAKTVDFGATDDPMKAEELDSLGLVQFPTVIGGIVPVINVAGIKPGELKLTGPLLADIYLGKITKWNDTAIQSINPDVKLPDTDILTVHRADGSGTTFGWTNYLSKVSPEWKEKVGEGKALKWPNGQGGKGNEGVAGLVRQVKNTIGYVEYAYAKQSKLTHVQVKNSAGKFVQPDDATFAAAAANAKWNSVPGMGVILTNQPGADSWPITSATFILMYKTQKDPVAGKNVTDFFEWAFKNGNASAAELDFVPLPDAVKDQVRAVWKTIK